MAIYVKAYFFLISDSSQTAEVLDIVFTLTPGFDIFWYLLQTMHDFSHTYREVRKLVLCIYALVKFFKIVVSYKKNWKKCVKVMKV